MKQIADLHTHTFYSDGKLSVAELFKKAEDAELAAISITDHDSIDGCIVAQEIKSEHNIDFINGIEFSCYENEREFHVLGYHLDINNPVLHSTLDEFKKARLKRAQKILEKLRSMSLTLDIDLILQIAGEAPITRPHIAEAMMDKGYISNLKEAFIHYLGEGKPAYEAKSNFSVHRAIKLINECGGVAVLAHPGRSISSDILYKLIEQGLDGIEVVHPMHDETLQKYYHSIASQYWLLETGGSDFHGTRDYDETNFGKFVVPYSVVDSIRMHALKR